MYQEFYQHFLNANAGRQHYACHSHYYWPDVTRDAMLQYWDDSACYVDDKWQVFFSELVPELQQHIAGMLNTGAPERLVFASNTHELLYRILSCFAPRQPLRIVSTDSEFHSFHRQANRLAEYEHVSLTSVPTQPLTDFTDRFIAAIKAQQPDVVFVSQVFFNSGFVVERLHDIVSAVDNPDTIIVIDGYHGFMAKPTDLSAIADRVFYLAGGYKYAQAGEGACFMHIPANCHLRPAYTGWFAEFGALDKPRKGQVQYSQDGMRFAGATMDFTALYRMRAVFTLFGQHGITVDKIDAHVMALQAHFLSLLDNAQHPLLNRNTLVVSDAERRGHFLTFDLGDPDVTAALAARLREHNIYTDYRGSRIRFGFALYHSKDTIDLSCIINGEV
ncbi:aminotransferase class V-fold PLP-dependent enzyme [Alteromonas sp. CYL-A6]|uniref:aminotransferase class V-fold PLP-dependent enzyme n=1 Tax=Alteromonas nitratireducens TaxID=3390813 RepID=UPI0034B3EBF5